MKRLLIVFSCALCVGAFAQTICIDPGHPSENGIGTKGKKVTEVGVAWQVGLHLSKLLQQAGYKVILTKNSERQMIKNAARAKIANEGKADLLLRLHCDAGTGSGLATYYPRETGTVGKISGPALSVRKASEKIALVFHPAVIKSLAGKLADSGLKTDRKTKIGAKQGALTGSILSKVPVVLVEMCVLQNAHDEAFIATLSGQLAMAKALFTGVKASVPRNRK